MSSTPAQLAGRHEKPDPAFFFAENCIKKQVRRVRNEAYRGKMRWMDKEKVIFFSFIMKEKQLFFKKTPKRGLHFLKTWGII